MRRRICLHGTLGDTSCKIRLNERFQLVDVHLRVVSISRSTRQVGTRAGTVGACGCREKNSLSLFLERASAAMLALPAIWRALNSNPN